MRERVSIPEVAKKKKPFISNGKRDSFVRQAPGEHLRMKRSAVNEINADKFAEAAIGHADILKSFQRTNLWGVTPKLSRQESVTGGGKLPENLSEAFRNQFGTDFSEVRVHLFDSRALDTPGMQPAAFTVGNHIYLNREVLGASRPELLYLLAHELIHTLQHGLENRHADIQQKPLNELHDRTKEQSEALKRAAAIATGEQGKVSSGQVNEDQTRVGWQYLVEYFKTTLGEENVIQNKADYKPGKFLEENIKYIKKGKAQKVRNINGELKVVNEDNVDVLPSWCGIFAFWALHKGGVHPPEWKLGKPNFTAKDQFKKGEYVPRPGDIVIKNGYNHHALVVRTEPEQISDTAELKELKVVTINGNTSGSNHQGGQIQLGTHFYSYWDYYVNPFFNGVQLEDPATYKVDDRLKESIPGENLPATPETKPADLTVKVYDTAVQPVGKIEIPGKEKSLEKEESQDKADPKDILKKDKAFGELNAELEQNARSKSQHETPEVKSNQAQASVVSPANERLSRAKSEKVMLLGNLPPPKKFDAAVLKKGILDEVDKLIRQKKENAAETGDIPKIRDNEIREIKEKNSADIQKQKSETVGKVEEAHRQAPDESRVEPRTSAEVVAEEPGKNNIIRDSSKAVAKPVADERITLEKESGKIDKKMADNEVDEAQLEESNEDKFTSALGEKRSSQSQAASLKPDYRATEEMQLAKEKKEAKSFVDHKVNAIHQIRKGEFGNVDLVKQNTKSAEEIKRKEIADAIEKIYSDSEKSVNDKLTALEKSVNEEFDAIMNTANAHFKKNVNDAMDDEFTWEWAAKKLDRDDYNRRVKKVFEKQAEKYTVELSGSLDPLTAKMAKTLNAIISEIGEARKAVETYVKNLDESVRDIGVECGRSVLDKFTSLEESVDEKQQSLTNGLAQKYADGVMNLESEFKKILDERKSWLERALDAIVDAVMEIVHLLIDLKKALERAAEYGKQIIKAPLRFFNNLVKGATEGFNRFVKNIAKHLLQGALEWITGQMGEAGIQLPAQFDFKGILSIILQILGITLTNIKEIARKVIGAKYVDMLEKGVDLGMKAGDKILQIFSIIRKDGLAGLWEFIKEQFNDLKERLMEEAKTFIVTTIVEVAVVKIVSMLIPGAGFISAVKSLIDFLRTLFARARQIVSIITGIIDTFGQILAGNVASVSSMIENVLAKFLGLAITFLAAILGLGKIGKKINDIIQKKIKEPINKAITKMMEKLKAVMTRLGIFKLMDNIGEKVKKGKAWVEEKKEKAKEKVQETVQKITGFLKGLTNKYTDGSGETHTLRFKELTLHRESVSKTLGNYLMEVKAEINLLTNVSEKQKHQATLNRILDLHKKIVDLIGDTVRKKGDKYTGADKGFSPKEGEHLRSYLEEISKELRTLPLKQKKNIIPKTKIKYKEGVNDGINGNAPLISLDSDVSGSQPAGANSPLTQKIIDIVLSKKDNHNLVRGHLINHELYGTGEGTKNLAPIPKKANSAMLGTFEKDAKNLVHSNQVISLDVSMKYGVPNDKKWSGKSLLKKQLSEGTLIPVLVTYQLQQLKFDKPSDSGKDIINDVKSWKKEGLSKAGSIDIHHDDFF